MIPTNSPFYAIVRYRATKLACESAAAVQQAKPRRQVRGTFGHGEAGTIPGLAPKDWNGPAFAGKRHGGAYSKAGPVLVPIKGHNLQKGKFVEPTIRKRAKVKP